ANLIAAAGKGRRRSLARIGQEGINEVQRGIGRSRRARLIGILILRLISLRRKRLSRNLTWEALRTGSVLSWNQGARNGDQLSARIHAESWGNSGLRSARLRSRRR